MSVEEININPPDDDVIDFIKRLLERAEAGDLQSIAVVTSSVNYSTGNGWAGMGKNNMAVVGECSCLHQELIDFFVERRKQPVFKDE